MLAAPLAVDVKSGIRAFHSCDPDEIIDYVGRKLAPHRMDATNPRNIEASLRTMDLASALIVDIQYGTNVQIDPEELHGYHLVHAAITGCSTAEVRGSTHQMRPDNLCITSPGRPVRIHMTAACRHLTVRISETALEEYLSRMLNIQVKQPIVFEPEVTAGHELPLLWRNLLSHLLNQMAAAPQAMSNPLTQRQYSTVMSEFLLIHHRHNYSDAIERSSNDISPWYVHRARDIIHQSPDSSLSVADLTEKVGVSARSLQNGFRQFLGMTPVEYVRRFRLKQLHQALCNASPNTNVTEIMLDCGIANFGRYAQYYKQLYGCRPSDTLKKST